MYYRGGQDSKCHKGYNGKFCSICENIKGDKFYGR